MGDGRRRVSQLTHKMFDSDKKSADPTTRQVVSADRRIFLSGQQVDDEWTTNGQQVDNDDHWPVEWSDHEFFWRPLARCWCGCCAFHHTNEPTTPTNTVTSPPLLHSQPRAWQSPPRGREVRASYCCLLLLLAACAFCCCVAGVGFGPFGEDFWRGRVATRK